MSEPAIAARAMVTESADLTGTEKARLRRLARASAIMESQTIDGKVLPIGRWPRRLRREFSRLAAKEGFQVWA